MFDTAHMSPAMIEGFERATASYSPIVNWNGREFFPGVSRREFDESVTFAKNNAKRGWRADRNSNPDCQKLQDVPPEVKRRTLAAAGGDYSIWNPEREGSRFRWWEEVVAGVRDSDWTANGPGCTAGMWVA